VFLLALPGGALGDMFDRRRQEHLRQHLERGTMMDAELERRTRAL
jgi:hypothetical protein